MNDLYEWEDKLDDGTPVHIVASDFEGADPDVGLGEGCIITATNAQGVEVELTRAEDNRFQAAAMNLVYADMEDYPDPPGDPFAEDY